MDVVLSSPLQPLIPSYLRMVQVLANLRQSIWLNFQYWFFRSTIFLTQDASSIRSFLQFEYQSEKKSQPQPQLHLLFFILLWLLSFFLLSSFPFFIFSPFSLEAISFRLLFLLFSLQQVLLIETMSIFSVVLLGQSLVRAWHQVFLRLCLLRVCWWEHRE